MSNLKHGMKGTKIYGVWATMLTRCQNPNCKTYKHYGGRGITVCESWQSFEGFYHDMGDIPEGMSIERVDNNKGYNPENCIWADRKSQQRNRRNVRLVTANGETKPLAEWAEEVGLSIGTLWNRLKLGWTPEEAVNTPKITKRKGIPNKEKLRYYA